MTTVKFLNTVTVVGTVEEVDLDFGESKKTGAPYVRGNVKVQVSEGNIVDLQVFQMKEVADRKNDPSGKTFIPNRRYQDLVKLVDENGAALESAFGTPIGITGSFEPNPFVSRDGEMVEATRLQGGFTNYSRLGAPRAEFKVTMSVRKVIEEIDRETEAPTGDLILLGDTYLYNGTKTPLRLYVEAGPGADYFMSLSEDGVLPLLTDVWGRIENPQLPPRIVESAFGEPQVIESTNTRTKYVVTGARVEPHDMTEELAEKIKEGNQAYEVLKAEAQERYDNKNQGGAGGSAFGGAAPKTAPAADKPKTGGFQF